MNTPEHRDDLDLVAHRFEWARIQLNLKVVDVVREAGYENINKGCRRLRNIENGKPEPEPVYQRFARVLDIDLEQLEQQLEEQRREREERFRQQLPPRELGGLVESARESAGLSLEQLAARTDGVVGLKRLKRLEGGIDRFPAADEIEALAEALSIDEAALRSACERERRIYDDLDEEPQLIIRPVPGFYATVPLPEPASTKSQLDYATEFARDKRMKVCLVFPDGRSVYIRPDGCRFERFEAPSMSIG